VEEVIDVPSVRVADDPTDAGVWRQDVVPEAGEPALVDGSSPTPWPTSSATGTAPVGTHRRPRRGHDHRSDRTALGILTTVGGPVCPRGEREGLMPIPGTPSSTGRSAPTPYTGGRRVERPLSARRLLPGTYLVPGRWLRPPDSAPPDRLEPGPSVAVRLPHRRRWSGLIDRAQPPDVEGTGTTGACAHQLSGLRPRGAGRDHHRTPVGDGRL